VASTRTAAAARQPLRDAIAHDVEAFLRAGGRVEVVERRTWQRALPDADGEE
jgi:hypothetical protein